MTTDDFNFVPRSDMEIDDIATVNSHNALISSGNFSDAETLLEEKRYKKGFVASFFNYVEEKIRTIQIYLLNKTAAPDEFYSYTEPTDAQMEGKLFWIKPIDD